MLDSFQLNIIPNVLLISIQFTVKVLCYIVCILSNFVSRLKGVHDIGKTCFVSFLSFMGCLAHLKDMCSLGVPLSSSHSISVPTLALLPPEVERAKSPVTMCNHRAKTRWSTTKYLILITESVKQAQAIYLYFSCRRNIEEWGKKSIFAFIL